MAKEHPQTCPGNYANLQYSFVLSLTNAVEWLAPLHLLNSFLVLHSMKQRSASKGHSRGVRFYINMLHPKIGFHGPNNGEEQFSNVSQKN